MNPSQKFPFRLDLPAELVLSLVEAAAMMADERRKYRFTHRKRVGATLRPGPETPLWNALADEIRPHLRTYGSQVNLGRLLGLPRQQVHAYFVQRTRMPDAERTLQLLSWLMAIRKKTPPA